MPVLLLLFRGEFRVEIEMKVNEDNCDDRTCEADLTGTLAIAGGVKGEVGIGWFTYSFKKDLL